jgi:hypothetical protein
MAETEVGFQDAINKLHEKQELGTFENYDSPAKTPSAFGEVSYGKASYSDEIS